MGEDPGPCGKQRGPEVAHAAAGVEVLLLDGRGLGEEPLAYGGVAAKVRRLGGDARILSMAQKRLTAVGRVAARSRAACSTSATSGGPALAERRAARATPNAAATPMAGAPRITMVRMASATSVWSLART